MSSSSYANVNLWDGVSEELLENTTITVKDGLIASIGGAVDSSAVDMGGTYAIPGLIDAHVHMCLDPEIRDPFAHAEKSDEEQLEGMRKRAGDMLRAGITTARDLGGGARVPGRGRCSLRHGRGRPHGGTRRVARPRRERR